MQSETLVITCLATSIQMRFTTDGRESTRAYTPDGKERTVKEVPGGEVVAKAKWKGPVLIIEMLARLKMPGDPRVNGTEVIHSKERWRLSTDGRMLTVEQDDDIKVVSVYDKLPI